ncbi:hypothetical protein XENOCAPTIV_023090, partial [Xenoophorus captivus]
VGDEGAGHFVKMVHNGIEYGDMQLICEAYHLMKDVLGMDHDEMAQLSSVFVYAVPPFLPSVFLGKIKEAFDRDAGLQNLLLDNFFSNAVQDCQESWRRTVSVGVQHGIPMPCFTTALSFYDGYRHDMLPANLLQVKTAAAAREQLPLSRWSGLKGHITLYGAHAQRDYFGAHTYELLSNPGHFIHTNWTGHGGNVSSSSYNA